MGGGDSDEAGQRKIEDEGVGSVRLGEGDGAVRPAIGPEEGLNGKNATVRGEVTVRQSGEISRASTQGAPTRRAWKKAHRAAGKGRAGEGRAKSSGSNGRVVTGTARQVEGATTSEGLACGS